MKLMLAARDEFPEGISRPAPKFIELVALFSPLRFNLFGSFLNCPGVCGWIAAIAFPQASTENPSLPEAHEPHEAGGFRAL